MNTEFAVTERTRLKRLPARGVYDRESVYGILDEGFVCHVGFIIDGQPFVIPTGYGRSGDILYLHGAKSSRMLKALARGAQVCVTVTLVDGLVLARSAFHHSMNYRSVVIFGEARILESDEEKNEALAALTDHIIPGRWREARRPNQQELAATLVLALPLAEASAKVRTGPPIDDEEDLSLNIWAGEIPLRYVAGEAIDSHDLAEGIAVPERLETFNPANRR
jgi:nitroimidazol reductase NimA-like FMN-containing flavoprotein (pyridoxamine 5'-phosphate oxidase superfamily)